MVTSKDSPSHSFQDVMRTRLSFYFFFVFVRGWNPVNMSDSCGRLMATARDGIPYMPSLPLSFKLWRKKNMDMDVDVTRWDLVEGGGSQPRGSRCSGSCASGSEDGR